MPATLTATDVTVVRGPSLVLSGASLTVAPGARVGMVGPNGVGKSTLLATLAGHLAPDSGAVSLSPRAATVGLLPQEPDRRPGETLTAFLARRTGVTAAQAELDAAGDRAARGRPRRLRGHTAAGHARPAAARGGRGDPHARAAAGVVRAGLGPPPGGSRRSRG